MRKTKAQLIKENEFLFELAAATDAHRLCDRNPEIIFREQYPRSQHHVGSLLKMIQQDSTKGSGDDIKK